jgi:hypothetical protein
MYFFHFFSFLYLAFFFLDKVCLIFFSSIYHLLHMEICVPGAGIYGYQLETQDGQPVEYSVQSGLIADRAGQDCFSLRRVTHRQSSQLVCPVTVNLTFDVNFNLLHVCYPDAMLSGSGHGVIKQKVE